MQVEAAKKKKMAELDRQRKQKKDRIQALSPKKKMRFGVHWRKMR